jgi:aryl-alcohol dehydrogenase-like predicted oxidoreductase
MSEIPLPNIGLSSVGQSALSVTQLGLGTAGLGDLFIRVPETEAQAIAQQAWDAGVRYFDTAPWYGKGKSEHRIGTFLRQQPRDEFVLSTKVGRVLGAPANPATVAGGPWTGPLPFDLRFDYTYDGIMRSWEDSLQRLSVNRVDILFIHDLDHLYFGTDEGVDAHLAQLYTSDWRALDELRRSGRIGAVGAGINRANMMPRSSSTSLTWTCSWWPCRTPCWIRMSSTTSFHAVKSRRCKSSSAPPSPPASWRRGPSTAPPTTMRQRRRRF